jgi:hypothetical protein
MLVSIRSDSKRWHAPRPVTVALDVNAIAQGTAIADQTRHKLGEAATIIA